MKRSAPHAAVWSLSLLSLSIVGGGCGESSPTTDDMSVTDDAAVANAVPFGWHDGINGRMTSGWTCDPNNLSVPLAIHFYDNGTFVGHTVANLVREPAVAAACGGFAAHGFNYELPATLFDGQRHVIYAFAINYPVNTPGVINPLLSGSPKVIDGSSVTPPPNPTPSGAPRDAAYVSMDYPSRLSPGQTANVSVTFRNTGNETWTAATNYRLGSQAPQDNSVWGFGRVVLDGSDRISTGQSKTFRFSIRAPATSGSYDFQWRMLQEAVAWFGGMTPKATITVQGATDPNARVCEALRALNGRPDDAAGVIQGCIDQTPAGQVLALPAGRYMMKNAVTVTQRAITLKTEGRATTSPKCAVSGSSGCAELIADPSLYRSGGIIDLFATGSTMDHIVIDGNRQGRVGTAAYNACAQGSIGYGYNMRVGSQCRVTNSVSKNALCGTAMEVSGTGTSVYIANNTIAFNGVHNRSFLWADGITVHDYPNSTFIDNEIIDNTDIDLIFGGCANCTVQRNVIRHTADPASGSYAALMIQAWPGATSGNYTGADFSGNHIDCGPSKACGFGILIGSDPWYSAPIHGGAVHHNTIANPQQGLTIEDASNVSVHHNTVSGRAATSRVSCRPSQPRATSDFSMGASARSIDTSADNPPAPYVNTGSSWVACIPNWGI
ncbi:MAG: right-handed parallel beta-helix repeat-containing protein [Deltaproteobacteria bacterium]|nr:right-handed parallel beta-helix repeat-containing protein [Deltaproteobacteria bacterium]